MLQYVIDHTTRLTEQFCAYNARDSGVQLLNVYPTAVHGVYAWVDIERQWFNLIETANLML